MTPKIRFDATINLGHILTFVGFLAAGAGMYTSLDKRVAVNEQKVAQHDRDLARLEENDKETIDLIRTEMRGVRDEIRELRKDLSNGSSTSRPR